MYHHITKSWQNQQSDYHFSYHSRQVSYFYTAHPAIGASVLTLPQEAAGASDVDVVVRHTGRDTHVAHALEFHF